MGSVRFINDKKEGGGVTLQGVSRGLRVASAL